MKTGNHFNLRIAGLGGQGVVTLATKIAEAAVSSGIQVSVIDRPRSAMRLCQIYCDIVFGQENLAPLISQSSADVVVGLEPLEGVRSATELVRNDGLVLLNASRVPQISEIVTGDPYPDLDLLIKGLVGYGARFLVVDVNNIALEESGSILGANFVMLGILAKYVTDFPISNDQLRKVIENDSINLRCFERGISYSA